MGGGGSCEKRAACSRRCAGARGDYLLTSEINEGGDDMNDANAEVQTRIVVGVDLSETGSNALREALRLGQYLPRSELHVTYVINGDAAGHDASRLKDIANELPARIGD